jgi:hypothetical protein
VLPLRVRIAQIYSQELALYKDVRIFSKKECMLLNFLKNTKKQVETVSKVLEKIDDKNRAIIAQQFSELQKINLTAKEKEVLTFFWHPIDQKVIEKVKYDAMEYCMELKEANYKNSGAKYKLQNALLTLKMHKIIENYGNDTSRANKDVTLTKSGIEIVTSENPRYSQFHLAYRDFLRNKIVVVITVVSFVTGKAGLVKLISEQIS